MLGSSPSVVSAEASLLPGSAALSLTDEASPLHQSNPWEEIYIYTQISSITNRLDEDRHRAVLPHVLRATPDSASDFAAAYATVRKAFPFSPFAPFFVSEESAPLMALYDTGALRAYSSDGLSVITLAAATRLNLKVQPVQLQLSGVGKTSIVGYVDSLPFECFTQRKEEMPRGHKHTLCSVFVVDTLQLPFLDLIISPEALRAHLPLRLGMTNLTNGSKKFSFLPLRPSSFVPCAVPPPKVSPPSPVGSPPSDSPTPLSKEYHHFLGGKDLSSLTALVSHLEGHDEPTGFNILSVADHEAVRDLQNPSVQAANLQAALDDPTVPEEAKVAIRANTPLFGELKSSTGCTVPPITVDLIDGTRPWGVCHQPVPKKPEVLEFLKAEIKKLLDDNIVARVPDIPGAADFTSPCLVVQSGQDNKLRLVQALLKLNAASKKFPYTLPTSPDLLKATAGKKWFTHLDLVKAFFQVRLHEASQQYFSFRLPNMGDFPGGRFQYLRMPLGWVNATYVFQRIMNNLFSDLISQGVVLSYLDDILILTDTKEEHLKVLSEVLKRLREAGFIANAKKCSFMQPHANFLGMRVDGNTVTILPKHLEALQKLPRPQSLKDLQIALGFFNYYRNLVPGFAQVAAPLYALTGPGTIVKNFWSPVHTTSFERLKTLLFENCSIHLPSGSGEFVVRTDASNLGYGGCVLQKQGDRFVPLGFYSVQAPRSIKHVGEIEMSAFSFVVSQAKDFLSGVRFTWESDHANLRAVNHKSPILQRVALDLQGFDFTFKHVPGKDMHDADFLSRLPALEWPKFPPIGCYMLLSAFQAYPSLPLSAFSGTRFLHLAKELSDPKLVAFPAVASSEASAMARRRSSRAATAAATALTESGVSALLPDIEESSLEEDLVSFNAAGAAIRQGVASRKATKARAILAEALAEPSTASSNSSSTPSSEAPTAGNVAQLHLPSLPEPRIPSSPSSESYHRLVQALRRPDVRSPTPLTLAICDAQVAFKVSELAVSAEWSTEPVVDQLGVQRDLHLYKGLIFIPQDATTLHLRLLSLVHDAPNSHPQVDTVMDSLSSGCGVIWPFMKRDAEAFIRSCYICQRTHARRTHRHVTPLHPRPPPAKPRMRLVADILGPMPSHGPGCPTHVLVIVDSLTRFTSAYPITPKTGGDPTSAEVISVFQRHMTFWGFPQELQTDRASIFHSEEFATFVKASHFLHHHTTPRHAQSNGLVEKLNDLIQISIRAHTGTRVEDWPDHLDQVISDLNDRKHSVLRCSPYEATFGFARRTHASAAVSGPLSPDVESEEELRSAIEALHKAITDLVALSHLYTRKDQEARANRVAASLTSHRTFKKGDFVLLQNAPTPGKLLSHFSPVPYEVISLESYDIYVLRNILSPKATLKAHASHMKLLDCSRTSPAQHLQYCLDAGEQVVHSIAAHQREADGSFKFLVEWDALGLMSSTWEPPEVLQRVQAFKDYVAAHNLRIKFKKRSASDAAMSVSS